MSDEQEPQSKLGERWGDDISDERRAELVEMLQTWEAEHGDRRSPFDNATLTGADVFWLAARILFEHAGGAHSAMEELRSEDYTLEWPTSLSGLHLEGANLSGAQLERAKLCGAHLDWANLTNAQLDGAILGLEHERHHYIEEHGIDPSLFPGPAHLEHAALNDAHLVGAILSGAHLQGAVLQSAHLEKAMLSKAQMEQTIFWEADLKGANLIGARARGATFYHAQMEGAVLNGAHLEEAEFRGAHLEGASFQRAHLQGADLSRAFFDRATDISEAQIGDDTLGFVSLADAHWGGMNLTIMDWTHPRRWFFGNRPDAFRLGDERQARDAEGRFGKPKSRAEWLQGYKNAVRANRQLVTELRQQGLTEDADRFAYRVQQLQRQVLRRQGRHGAALGSWLLDVVAGYGYRPMRSLIAYVVIILAFAGAYLLNAQFAAPHLTWDEALVLSISAFHGRGFFTSSISLSDTLARLAAGEAIIGLLIEITFIATFTQRFFAR